MLSVAFVKAMERMASTIAVEIMASANAAERIEDDLLEGHREDELNGEDGLYVKEV